jgi:hypothetical protein
MLALAVALASIPSRVDARDRASWPGRSVPSLVACAAPVPDDFGELPEPAGDDSDDDDTDDDEASDDEDPDTDDAPSGPDSAGEWPGGGFRTGIRDCLFVQGEINAGFEATRFLGRSARQLGTRMLPGTITTTVGSFSLIHVTDIGQGSGNGAIVTRLSVDGDADGLFTLTEASVSAGRFLAGLSSSRFDVWTGEEFSFRALASSQSPSLFAMRLFSRPSAGLTISLEDPSFRRVTTGGYGGMAMPDIVARATLRQGPAQFDLSAAWHETRLAGAEQDRLEGYALQGSLRLDLPWLSDDSYLIAQSAYAHRALGYLGINTRTNTLGILLPGVLGATVAERGDGTSGALVFVHQFAPEWRVAAFVSGSRIVLERDCGGCRVTSTRGAVNLTWMPAPGLEIALEAGGARTASTIPLLASGRRWSTTLSVSRSF